MSFLYVVFNFDNIGVYSLQESEVFSCNIRRWKEKRFQKKKILKRGGNV